MPVSKSKRKKRKDGGHSSGARAVAKPTVKDLLSDQMAKELDSKAAIADLRTAGEASTLDDMSEALDLVYDAWDSDVPDRQVELAKQALLIYPWCGDAYAVLAQNAPPGSDLGIHLWRMAVAASEFALKAELGEDVFEAHAGDFWGLSETRPYIRARLGLARELWDFGEREEALAIDLDILRLNPGDNNGVRYVAAARLLTMGKDEGLARLFESYPGEDDALLVFTRLAWWFRRHGDSEHSRRLLVEAVATNPHVPIYLLGRRRMPDAHQPFYEPGEESEAVQYAELAREAWCSVPGALTWLGRHARYPFRD